jgi:aminopeptidase
MHLFSQNDQALAQQILDFSCEIKAGEKILIQLIGLNGIGLARALAIEARKRKAIPFFRMEDTELNKVLLEEGNSDYWSSVTATEALPLMKQMDAYVGIRASENIYESSSVTKEAMKAYEKDFLIPVHFEQRVKHTKWVIMRYPSPAFAMNAKMSTSKFVEYFYKACLVTEDDS